jgi:hypothetical protein
MSKTTIKVRWIADEGRSILRRDQVEPSCRMGNKPVSLAWLEAKGRELVNPEYDVRWWEGESATKGQWKDRQFPYTTTLKDIKSFAFMMAATVPWEVEICLRARTHGNSGWEYGARVWTFGRFVQETEAAQRLRGEL